MTRGRASLCVALVTLVASSVSAQESAPAVTTEVPPGSSTADDPCSDASPMPIGAATNLERARELFADALVQVEDEQWVPAEAGFRASYMLSGSPVAVFNLAFALRALGRHVEARDAFCMAAGADELDDEIRAQARELAAAELALTAILAIPSVDPPDASILVDGRAVSAPPIDVRVDSGRVIRLEASAEGYQPLARRLTFEPGERQSLPLPLEPNETIVRRDDTAVWIVVASIGAAVVIGGVALSVWAYDDAQLDPTYPDATIRFP